MVAIRVASPITAMAATAIARSTSAMVKPRRSAISSTSTSGQNLVGDRLRLGYNHQVHHRGGSTFPDHGGRFLPAAPARLYRSSAGSHGAGIAAQRPGRHRPARGADRRAAFLSEAAYSDGRSFSLYEPDSTICSFLSGRNPQSSNPPSLAMDDFYSLGSFSPHINWKRFLVIYHDAAKSKLCYKEFAYASNEIARIDNDHLERPHLQRLGNPHHYQ